MAVGVKRPENKIRKSLRKAPDNRLDQDLLIERLTNSGLEEEEVYAALKEMMRKNEISHTSDWQLILED
ncbi:hypothetical protein Huta_0796 [Halorhabdus utahensis DSM 12940]|uniref:Uncharacterized protein n=1 Tax=Halorhabdus utahensis (strain DSM 12940 / JCM 11049 / AX-2) TaxID=519442 RepID=C7NU84_HALUD|nr:hypothetical protein [Halorhabdus utahensis]ACV10981.1 hypothetical protein Huta_0796 [Halorhabdus utahensis DSM 12940]